MRTHHIVTLLVGVLVAPLWVVQAHTDIPEVIDVGSYTVTGQLPDGWRVEVYRDQESVVYRYAEVDSIRRQLLSEVVVVRVKIHEPERRASAADLAKRVVQDAEALLKDRTLVRKLYWRKDGKGVESCAAGEVHLFHGRDRRLRHYFYDLAVILPSDYASRGVVYFVFAHESNEAAVDSTDGRRNHGRFAQIVQGIREKTEANQALQTTRVTRISI